MKTRSALSLLAGLALTVVSVPGFAVDTSKDTAVTEVASPPADAKQSDYEELAQGPVHEAFAEPVVFDPEPGLIVPNAPPDPIKEIQPQEKPDGADVVWIGGYWGWDAPKKDSIWVSGIWRVQPPEHQWQPGYWNKVDGGYQWIPGFWQATEAGPQSVKIKLPKPPKSLEKGPSSPQPGENHVWIPGYWDYSGSDYAWSGGYWTLGYADHVYIPAHYVWHPDGYVWVGGYWDYPVASRGLLFAPVYFPSPSYTRVGFTFTPGLVISASFFGDNIFVSPGYGHYYVGNYYDPSCIGFGVYPTYSPVFLAVGYSDIWEHESWDHHNQDNNWDRNKYKTFREAYQRERQDRFERLGANATERPARTIAENAARFSGKEGQRSQLAARPIKDLLADKTFVEPFVKQSKQGQVSARQAIVERRAARTAVPQAGASSADPSARTKAVTTPNNRPGSKATIERKQPAVQPKETQQSTTPTPDSSSPEKAVATPNNRPGGKKATIERKQPAVQPKETQQSNTPTPDSSSPEKAVATPNNRPGSKATIERKQPVQDTDKSVQDRTPEAKASDPAPATKSDKTRDMGKDPQSRSRNKATPSGKAVQDEPVKDDKARGNDKPE